MRSVLNTIPVRMCGNGLVELFKGSPVCVCVGCVCYDLQSLLAKPTTQMLRNLPSNSGLHGLCPTHLIVNVCVHVCAWGNA